MSENEKRKLQVVDISFTHTVEDIPPPPPGFTSPFKTLQEWLFNICESNEPVKSVPEYSFGLYEPPGNSLINLVGYNHTIEQGSTTTRIIFCPTHTFFALPKGEYGHLSQEQVKKHLLKELIEFTKTTKFQNSFLSKGYSITTSFGGEIWSR